MIELITKSDLLQSAGYVKGLISESAALQLIEIQRWISPDDYKIFYGDIVRFFSDNCVNVYIPGIYVDLADYELIRFRYYQPYYSIIRKIDTIDILERIIETIYQYEQLIQLDKLTYSDRKSFDSVFGSFLS